MGEGPQHVRPDEGGGRPPAAGEPSEQDPETLRRDISATRDDMGQTLDEISDRVRPSRIVERRSARMRSAFRRARDRVMGSGQDAGQGTAGVGEQARTAAGGMRQAAGSMREAAGGMRERAGQAAGSVEHAPEAALERARGNPLGAGLIAFGAGVVAAGLLPETRSEQRVAMAVTDQLEPVTERLGEAASEVGHEVADSAREAARSTADHAREEVREAARDVRQEGSR